MTATVEDVERVQLDESSWVDVARGWLPGADELYAELVETVPWQESRVFKYDRWVDEPRLGAWFHSDAAAPPALLEAQRRIQQQYKVRFTSFSLVWYRDGRDLMAFHRDRDLKWLDETVVALLTLGARRPWRLRPRSGRYDHEAADKGATHEFAPAGGDLLVLGGATQRGWEHGVPPVREPVGGRISVQWRWTSKRGRQELGGSYRKPLHYAR